jgi:hypothetical protein
MNQFFQINKINKKCNLNSKIIVTLKNKRLIGKILLLLKKIITSLLRILKLLKLKLTYNINSNNNNSNNNNNNNSNNNNNNNNSNNNNNYNRKFNMFINKNLHKLKLTNKISLKIIKQLNYNLNKFNKNKFKHINKLNNNKIKSINNKFNKLK